MKLFKTLFILFFIFAIGLFVYFTPYFFLHSILKASEKGENISSYINEELIEYNIFQRYRNNIYADITPKADSEMEFIRKQSQLETIKVGISLLISPENLSQVFKAIYRGKSEMGKKVNYSIIYLDLNTFVLEYSINNENQQFIFKRKNVIIWELQDILFKIDISKIK